MLSRTVPVHLTKLQHVHGLPTHSWTSTVTGHGVVNLLTDKVQVSWGSQVCANQTSGGKYYGKRSPSLCLRGFLLRGGHVPCCTFLPLLAIAVLAAPKSIDLAGSYHMP